MRDPEVRIFLDLNSNYKTNVDKLKITIGKKSQKNTAIEKIKSPPHTKQQPLSESSSLSLKIYLKVAKVLAITRDTKNENSKIHKLQRHEVISALGS